jgi:hypothetical protein
MSMLLTPKTQNIFPTGGKSEYRKEVHIRNLVIGEKYYAAGNYKEDDWFRGVFTEYWTNTSGYLMLRFRNSFFHTTYFSCYVGSREEQTEGLYWRVFDQDNQQSFKYYNESRFTSAQKKELSTRCVLRERRQYERSLTGSTKFGIWIPRSIVLKIRQYII